MDAGEGHRDLERIRKLRELNRKDPAWVNSDIYRGYLYRSGLYTSAHEHLKRRPGKVTPGDDAETLDGCSPDEIDRIIASLKDESYQPGPSWERSLRQADGKTRKPEMPGQRDRFLQEGVRVVLEAIYEPAFSQASHGFRVGQGPHTALREIQREWGSTNWIVEGNVRGCFGEVHHEILIGIMRKRISDERFLNLIRKFLKCGYVEKEMETRNDLIDTPQGGILSSVLANIYLDRLDKFVESLQKEYERGTEKRENPAYSKLAAQKKELVRRGETRTRAFGEIIRAMRQFPALDPCEENFIRVRYIRYADDWIIGVAGSKKLAEEIKGRVRTFLKNELRLELSDERTKITSAREEPTLFLGVKISIDRASTVQRVKLSNGTARRSAERQSTGWKVIMKAPLETHIRRLAEKNFCNTEGVPASKRGWINLDVAQIIQRFSALNRGIQNYYRFCDNFAELRRIQYVLKYSLARTLAEKYKTGTARIFDRGRISTKVTTSHGEKEVAFYQNRNWKTNRNGFKPGGRVDQIEWGTRPGTRSNQLRSVRRST